MAGIYIHIPFCKKICYYCDFFKSRDLSRKGLFLEALKAEMGARTGEGKGETFHTVYFGGGTPSVLLPEEVSEILNTLHKHYRIDEGAEITVEANPEDVTANYCHKLLRSGVNRISIGCQSFRDVDLRLMHRRHNADRAREAIEIAANAGFRNISGDLIYGIPGLSLQGWQENLVTLLELPVQHISAYLLTFEPGTVFGKWVEKGKIKPPPEELVIQQYNALVGMTGEKGFVHYEISNFAKEGFCSRHNMIYWSGEKYLGFGPSAHSYDQRERKWNTTDLRRYIAQEHIVSGREVLSEADHFNDYILTSLRTIRGVEKDYLERNFPDAMVKAFHRSLARWIASSHVKEWQGRYFLTDRGLLLSDTIISDCMII